ncbi:MAG: FtsX-like permease family protein [Luteitalea sp.]|nr:FtsX-like permease family protein [Luteitalea sp.]
MPTQNLWRRLLALLNQRQRDADLDEEMRLHIDLRAAKLQREGLAPEDARRLARTRFGNTTRVREASEDAWGWRWLTDVLQDLRYAARLFAKAPIFAAVAITTLALGIGANTAMFSIIHAVLLRPLPYQDADRLVGVWGQHVDRPQDVPVFTSFRAFQEWHRHSRSFAQVEGGMWAGAGQTLLWKGVAQRVLPISVTAGFFSLLGVEAARGRTFETSDRRAGCTVVLSDGFWKNRLGGSADVVGGSLTLNHQACTVIGIMPQGFEFYPKAADLWTLITPESPFEREPLQFSIGVFGRLKPNVSAASAQAELAILHQQAVRDAPRDSGWRQIVPVVNPLQQEFTYLAGGNLRTALVVLFAAVVCVLLIACVNVANLQLARTAERERELAIRATLGSGRSRLVRQLITESMILAVLGAALGTSLAIAGVNWFRHANPVELPAGNAVTVNWAVLLFTGSLAILAGLLSGLMPARKASRTDLNGVLKETTRGGTSGALAHRTTRLFIIAEVALSVTLLAGAGLLIQSIARLSSVPLGFRTDHLLTAQLSLETSSYPDLPSRAAFYESLTSKLRTLPGVQAVGMSSSAARNLALAVAGRAAPKTTLGDVSVEDVNQDYLAAMGIPLLRGRPFETTDREHTQPVAIVNDTLARRYFRNEAPIGRHIKLAAPDGESPWLTIVGTAGDVKGISLFNTMSFGTPSPLVYRPLTQSAGSSVQILLRTSDTGVGLASALQREVSALDGDVPIHDVRTMEQKISESMAHAVSSHASEWLCWLGPPAGGDRDLRNAVGVGVASHARDWCAHGVGSAAT